MGGQEAHHMFLSLGDICGGVGGLGGWGFGGLGVGDFTSFSASMISLASSRYSAEFGSFSFSLYCSSCAEGSGLGFDARSEMHTTCLDRDHS